MPEIVYVAGETSGDRHAAALHRELIAARPADRDELRAWGVGGKVMRDAGIETPIDSSSWGAMGVVESVRGLPEYLGAMRRLKERLAARKPDALILIDFGYFNVRLARWAKKHGIGPIVYYLPPGSWKRRAAVTKGSRELASLCDLIVTPFQWSERHLRAAGANCHWVGHPLLDIAHPAMEPADFDREFRVDAARPIIALLPGSRSAEIENILPLMLRATELIAKRLAGSQFLLAAAPNLHRERLEKILRDEQDRMDSAGSKLRIIERAGDKLKKMAASAIDAASPSQALVTNEGFVLQSKKPCSDEERRENQPSAAHGGATLAIVENLTYDCLARADLVITASGTATLEAAILVRPMLIVYRGSHLMEIEYKLRKSRLGIDFIGMPNIIAGQKIVPEFIQDEATPEAVADAAIELLIDPERMNKEKHLLQSKVKAALGEPGAIRRAAQLVWQTIGAGAETSAAGQR